MVDTWRKFDSWIHTKKMLLLIVAIAVFFPIVYLLLYPLIGTAVSIVIYLVYLIVVAFLIRNWGKRKFEEES